MTNEATAVMNEETITEEQTTVIPWMELPIRGSKDEETGEEHGGFLDEIVGENYRELIAELFDELNITTLGELRASWDKIEEARSQVDQIKRVDVEHYRLIFAMINELILTFRDHYDDAYVESWERAWPEFFEPVGDPTPAVDELPATADEPATAIVDTSPSTDGPLPGDWKQVYDHARELVTTTKELFELNNAYSAATSHVDYLKEVLKGAKAKQEEAALKVSAKIRELEELSDPDSLPLFNQDQPPAAAPSVSDGSVAPPAAEIPSTDGEVPADGDESATEPAASSDTPSTVGDSQELTPEIRATPLAELDGWKRGKLAKLQEAGVDTLGDLLDFQAKHGEWWTKEIKGFGESGLENCDDVMAKFWAGRRSQ